MSRHVSIAQSTTSVRSSVTSVISQNLLYSFWHQIQFIFLSVDSSTVRGRSLQRFRLLGLPFIPVIILIAVCIQQLVSYGNILNGYRDMYDRAEFGYAIAKLCTQLEHERSALAYTFLSEKSLNEKHNSSDTCVNIHEHYLEDEINETNQALDALNKLPWRFPESEIKILKQKGKLPLPTNYDEFKAKLNSVRFNFTAPSSVDCEKKFNDIIRFYTMSMQQFIDLLPDFYEVALTKVTFMHIYAFQQILVAHETFSALCYLAYQKIVYGEFLNDETQIYFVGNYSVGIVNMNSSLNLDESLQDLYDKLIGDDGDYKEGEEFLDYVKAVVNGTTNKIPMSFPRWYNICRQFSQINELLKNEIIGGARREGFDHEWYHCITGIVLYSLALVVNIPAIIFIYLNSETTVKNLKQFSSMFRSQAKELLSEKDRTELLLSEMLPKSVARQLRLGNTVEAETYETSTIYFSDIVDFNEITLHTEPMQVISLLNSVYNLLDSRIECYDVYKVETIGSVYMVVSGVPVRNGQQHVVEVADMSLDILANIEEQTYPGVTKKIELRIGIHTGPCVAGVVGNKMTRYCLFGDTVNTASRMQSTGLASRIHLSESTYLALNATKGYKLQKRGLLEVKGKGTMTTYWLDGKDNSEESQESNF